MCQLAMADPSGGILCPRDDIPIHGGGNCPELGIYDPFDFSWVKSYGAFGDSFAAGIGVGNLRPDVDAKACSRYSGGYPAKVQAVIQAQNFQFVACSGDTSKDILATQFAKLLPISSTFDLITMSAGGNDVGFSDVLKACLFLGPTVSFLPHNSHFPN
jgi:lysophospholipase L1-like esterase